MRTLDEFNKEHPRAPRGNVANLRMLGQEAVRMDRLTGDEHWDHFLSYLEFALKETKKHLEIQRDKLSDPGLVNDEQIRQVKANAAQSEARIWTLEEVIGLPKALKEQANLAQYQIEALGLDK